MYRQLFCLTLCYSPLLNAAELQLTINNIKTTDGAIMIALFNQAQHADFPYQIKQAHTLKIPAQLEQITASFSELENGRYAVACYHDENANAQLDMNWLGIPQEAYGFSNDAQAQVLGTPSFEQAAFDLTETVSLAITLTD